MAAACYLKIDGADGESKDKGHTGWIDVESWAWGADQPQTTATGGGSGAGRVSMNPLHVTAKVFKGANTLFLFCANGKHLPSVKLEQTKAGETPQVYLKITLEDAIVTSFNVGGAGHDDVPIATFSFSAAKNKMWYAPQGKSGSVEGGDEKGWDVKENHKL
jgi:type VI secretion system secreted protein Hcp